MRRIVKLTAIVAVTVCAGLSVATVPARADSVTREVSTRGLDLRVAADRATLRHRVLVAARQVCARDGEDGVDITGLGDCEAEAFHDGWAQAEVKIAAARAAGMVAAVASR